MSPDIAQCPWGGSRLDRLPPVENGSWSDSGENLLLHLQRLCPRRDVVLRLARNWALSGSAVAAGTCWAVLSPTSDRGGQCAPQLWTVGLPQSTATMFQSVSDHFSQSFLVVPLTKATEDTVLSSAVLLCVYVVELEEYCYEKGRFPLGMPTYWRNTVN